MLADALDFLESTVDDYPYDQLVDVEFPLAEIESALEASENRDLARATLVPPGE